MVLINEGFWETLDRNPPEVFHYTSIKAFLNIIKSGELWFSNLNQMNDATEMVGFLDDLVSKLGITMKKEEAYVSISNKLKERFNKLPFAMSFTFNEDDAAQWERYGDRAKGIMLTFDEIILQKLFFPFAKMMAQPKPFSVNSAVEICRNYILYKKEFKSDEELVEYIYKYACLWKHQSFLSENELRIFLEDENVFVRKELVDDVIVKQIMKVDLRKLCGSQNLTIEDLIVRVTIGPHSRQNIGDMQLFLRGYGLNRLSQKISFSNCPLRK